MSTHGDLTLDLWILCGCGICDLVDLVEFYVRVFDTPTRCVLEIYLDRPSHSFLILESGSPLTSIPQHWLLISPVRYVFLALYFLSSGFSHD